MKSSITLATILLLMLLAKAGHAGPPAAKSADLELSAPSATDPVPEQQLGATVVLQGRRFTVVQTLEPKPPAANAVRYRIVVERPLEDLAIDFGRRVEQELAAAKGWGAADLRLVRVNDDADVQIVLARPETVDKLCAPLDTAGVLSCTMRRRAVLNSFRWQRGAASWGKDVEGYRGYLINHEVGHLLGAQHARCPEAGAPAPVMMQQTKHVLPCRPNAHPTLPELEALDATRRRKAAQRR